MLQVDMSSRTDTRETEFAFLPDLETISEKLFELEGRVVRHSSTPGAEMGAEDVDEDAKLLREIMEDPEVNLSSRSTRTRQARPPSHFGSAFSAARSSSPVKQAVDEDEDNSDDDEDEEEPQQVQPQPAQQQPAQLELPDDDVDEPQQNSRAAFDHYIAERTRLKAQVLLVCWLGLYR